jgi:hypothetical protein
MSITCAVDDGEWVGFEPDIAMPNGIDRFKSVHPPVSATLSDPIIVITGTVTLR